MEKDNAPETWVQALMNDWTAELLTMALRVEEFQSEDALHMLQESSSLIGVIKRTDAYSSFVSQSVSSPDRLIRFHTKRVMLELLLITIPRIHTFLL